MFLVLGIVIFFTMLGFMGLQLADRDSSATGSVLDIRSRDVATRSGVSLALAAMSRTPVTTATELQKFIADSSSGSPRQWMNFSTSPFAMQSSDPGWYVIGSGSDESAVKVRVVSMDIGDATGPPSDGVRITLECQAKGRNSDAITVLASYRLMGMQVPLLPVVSATNNFALYLNGSLANSNMGNTIVGDVYINGNTSLNGPATMNISGALRVNGDFTTNAPTTATGNSVIGGSLYTNGTGPMTFSKSLVVKGGINTMNANLTVGQNLDVQGTGTGGSWNNTSTLTVGGQFWYRSECRDIGGKLAIGGNAFLDGCLRLTGNVAHSFANVYVGRGGGAQDDYLTSGSATVSGVFGDWHTGAGATKFYTNSHTLTINGNMLVTSPAEQQNGGQIWVKGNAQFLSGIGLINAASGIRVDGTTYINASNQMGNFNGGMSLGNDLTMKGSVNDTFGGKFTGIAWAFQVAAPSKVWKYERSSCLSTIPDPRVTNSSKTNATACNAVGTIATPAALFSAPTPVPPSAYGADSFSTHDLDLAATQTWNQPLSTDISKVTGIVDLISDSLVAAGANTDNLTASDFNKIYARFKKANGWMVVRVGASSSIGSISAPAGTFSGKALWIIEKTVNVGGNWPGSTATTDYQFLWVRGTGNLASFGSPANFSGYVRFDNAFNGQMQWGTVTMTGAIHFAGGGSSVTGNGSANLTINNSQAIFDAINSTFPGVLSDPTGGGGGASTTSTRTLAARQNKLQFVPIGEYR